MTGYMKVLYELSGAVLYSDQVSKRLFQEWHMLGMSDIIINVGFLVWSAYLEYQQDTILE